MAGRADAVAGRRPYFGWVLVVVLGLTTTISYGTTAYLIGRGLDRLLAASLAGLIGLLSLPGRLVVNLVSDRFGAQRLLGICLAVQALALGVLIFGRSVAAIYAYAVLYGLAFGTRSPLPASAMAEHFGRRAYGAITAAQGVPVALAAGVGPLAAGLLHDRVGDYQPAFGLTALAFAVSSATVLLTPRQPAR